MAGSGIFAVHNKDGKSRSGNCFPTLTYEIKSQNHQRSLDAISKISSSRNETVPHRKPVSQAWVAKQRELSGTMLDESESRFKKQLSDAKSRELNGHDIFAPKQNLQIPKKFQTTPTRVPNNFLFGEKTAAEIMKKNHAKKVAELTGNGIFKDNAAQELAKRKPSKEKLKEISGDNIFADKKAPLRYYLSGIRKPPGGESSIVLV